MVTGKSCSSNSCTTPDTMNNYITYFWSQTCSKETHPVRLQIRGFLSLSLTEFLIKENMETFVGRLAFIMLHCVHSCCKGHTQGWMDVIAGYAQTACSESIALDFKCITQVDSFIPNCYGKRRNMNSECGEAQKSIATIILSKVIQAIIKYNKAAPEAKSLQLEPVVKSCGQKSLNLKNTAQMS